MSSSASSWKKLNNNCVSSRTAFAARLDVFIPQKVVMIAIFTIR